MAKKEDIQNQKDLNNEKRETANIDRDINNETSRTKTLEEQIIELLSTRRGINSDVLSDQQDIANSLQDQVKQQQFITSEKRLTRDISNSVTKIAQEAYSITSKELGLSKTANDLTKQQETLEKNIILAKQQQAKFSEMSNSGDTNSKRLNAEIASSLGDQAKQAKEVSRQIAQTVESSDAIAKTKGVKAFGLMGDVAEKLGMSKIAGPVQEAAEAARAHGAEQIEMNAGINKGIGDYKQFRAEGMKMGDALKKAGVSAKQVKVGKLPLKASGTLKAGFKALGPILKKAMGPVGLIVEAVQAFIQIDKAAGETAKAMGISAAEGAKMNAEMADAAAMSGDLLVSSKDVVKANMELNKIFGTSVAFSGKMAVEFAAISEKTGLSSKAMGIFAEKAMLSGTSIKDQLKKVTAVTMEMSAQTGVMLNAKDIQEGIGEMSHAQMLTTGMNTDEMAKQVFQAKLLGVSQSQLASMGEALLDFESSINAEMEAELLTGKQLNLEGARAAALAGDQAALAAELRKEVGTAAEFGKMNVIQQKAMAKAFGMSREEMSVMLAEQMKLESVKKAGFKSASDAQEQYNKALEDGTLTEELKADLAKAGVLNQMESATQADKLAAVMEKITDLFVQLVDPLMPLVDALIAILDPIFAILSPILKLVGDLVGLIVSYLQPAFDELKTLFGGIAEMMTGIFTLDFGMMVGGFKKVGKSILSFVLSPLDAAIKLANYIPGVNIPLPSDALGSAIGLAEGGVVTGPTNALVGEGSEAEAVLPLSKLANMLPSGLAIGDAVLNAATSPMRGIMNTIGSIFDQGDIGDAIKNPISGLMDTVSGMFSGGSSPISGLMDTVSGMFSGGSSPISGLMDTIGGIFDGDSIIDKVSNIATDTVGNVFGSESLGDILKSPLEGITSPMEGIGKLTDMLPSMSSPMSGISEMVSSAKSGISNFLGTGDDKEINSEEVSLLLKELITTVKEGGDVYLDGTKVGYTLALQSSKMA